MVKISTRTDAVKPTARGTMNATRKGRIAKEPTDDYSRRSTDAQIVDALREEFGVRFDDIERIEYIGTDWQMGSQYYAVVFKSKPSEYYDGIYNVVTCIDWSGNKDDSRGITFQWGEYDLDYDTAIEVMNEKIDRESRGTRKSVRRGRMARKSSVRKGQNPGFASKVRDLETLAREIDRSYREFWDNAPKGYWEERESNLYNGIDGMLDDLEFMMNEYASLLAREDFVKSRSKKSKNCPCRKADVDEIEVIEEVEDTEDDYEEESEETEEEGNVEVDVEVEKRRATRKMARRRAMKSARTRKAESEDPKEELEDVGIIEEDVEPTEDFEDIEDGVPEEVDVDEEKPISLTPEEIIQGDDIEELIAKKREIMYASNPDSVQTVSVRMGEGKGQVPAGKLGKRKSI